MIKKTAEINISTNADKAAKSLTSVKTQLKEANLALIEAQDKFGDYSKEALAAARSVAALKDKIAEARETADLFDPGKKFQAFAGALSAVSGGFAVVQGAMGAFGAESEDVEKMLLKVNSAMALTTGLSAIADSGKDFKRLGTLASGAFDNIKKSASTTFTGIKGGIAATGLGIFLIALGAIVANWDDIKKSVTNAFPAFKNIGTLFNSIKQIAFGAGEAIKNYVLMPFKALGKVLQGDFKGALEEVKNGFAFTKNFQAGAAKELQSQQDAAAKVRLENLIKQKEKELEVNKAAGKDTFNEELALLNNKKKLYKDNQEELEKVLQDERILRASHGKKLADEAKAAAAKSAAEKKAADAKAKAEADAVAKKALDDEAARFKSVADYTKNAIKELQDINDKSDQEKLDRLKQRGLDEIDALKATDAEKANLIALHNEKYFTLQQELDTKLKAQKDKEDAEEDAKNREKAYKQFDDLINDNTATFEERGRAITDKQIQLDMDLQNGVISQEAYTKATKDNSESREQLHKAEASAQLDTMAAVGNALQSLGDIAGEQTAAGKALGIASATINTFIGISQVWAAATMGNPILDMAVKIASTVAVAAAGFANVKKILAVKVPAKGGSGGGGAAPTMPARPSVSFQNSPQTQITDSIAQSTEARNAQPINLTVSANELTEKQNQIADTKTAARYN